MADTPVPQSVHGLHIRRLAPEDLPELARLYKQFWGEASDIGLMAVQFERLRAAGRHVFLCAVEGRRFMGSVMGILCEELYGDCKPFMILENLIVDEAFRKRGAGRLLVAELERIAREMGCTQILLITATWREDACAFYAAAGYDPATHRGFKKKL